MTAQGSRWDVSAPIRVIASHWWRIVQGSPAELCRTTNIFHSLASLTSIACIDKQGTSISSTVIIPMRLIGRPFIRAVPEQACSPPRLRLLHVFSCSAAHQTMQPKVTRLTIASSMHAIQHSLHSGPTEQEHESHEEGGKSENHDMINRRRGKGGSASQAVLLDVVSNPAFRPNGVYSGECN